MEHLLVHKKRYLFVALIWTIIIAVLCLEPTSNLPSIKVVGIDKIVHISFHFIFTLLWFLFFFANDKSKNITNCGKKAFFLSVLYGIFIEIAQQIFTTTRQADVLDVIANTTGAILAIVFISLLNRYKRFG